MSNPSSNGPGQEREARRRRLASIGRAVQQRAATQPLIFRLSGLREGAPQGGEARVVLDLVPEGTTAEAVHLSIPDALHRQHGWRLGDPVVLMLHAEVREVDAVSLRAEGESLLSFVTSSAARRKFEDRRYPVGVIFAELTAATGALVRAFAGRQFARSAMGGSDGVMGDDECDRVALELVTLARALWTELAQQDPSPVAADLRGEFDRSLAEMHGTFDHSRRGVEAVAAQLARVAEEVGVARDDSWNDRVRSSVLHACVRLANAALNLLQFGDVDYPDKEPDGDGAES